VFNSTEKGGGFTISIKHERRWGRRKKRKKIFRANEAAKKDEMMKFRRNSKEVALQTSGGENS